MKRAVAGILALLMMTAGLMPVWAVTEETWVQAESIGAYIPTYEPDATNPYATFYQGPFRGELSQFVIRFDLSALPKGVAIASASLELFCTQLRGIDNKTNQFTYERIVEPWDAAKVTANTRPKTSSGDIVAVDFPSAAMKPFKVDLTAFVRGWYQGDFPNYGLLARAKTVGPAETLNASFVNSFNERVEFRPKLIVIYTK